MDFVKQKFILQELWKIFFPTIHIFLGGETYWTNNLKL